MVRTGRPREFDTDAALDRARDVFQRRGYAGTSVQHLTEALDLQRGSLYAAFGDKHELYLKAVDLYARRNREQLRSMLADGPVLPVLRRLLTDTGTLTSIANSPVSGRGCLVGNTTAELVPQDRAAQTLIARAFDGFIEVVATALRRGQDEGEIDARHAPEVQAQLLLVLFQGAALVSRATADRARLTEAIDTALDALRTG